MGKLADYLSYKGDLAKSLKRRNWVNYNECKKIAKKNNIINNRQWRDFVISSNNYNLPRYPNETYMNKGWKSWDDFLIKIIKLNRLQIDYTQFYFFNSIVLFNDFYF